ncbi:hypothetical protein JB92DRAFT_2881827, partial [Gautieria morchelliformis]
MVLATALVSLLVVVRLVKSRTAPVKRYESTVCNGSADLCGCSYVNVTPCGAHDSYAFSKDPLAGVYWLETRELISLLNSRWAYGSCKLSHTCGMERSTSVIPV